MAQTSSRGAACLDCRQRKTKVGRLMNECVRTNLTRVRSVAKSFPHAPSASKEGGGAIIKDVGNSIILPHEP